MKVIKVGEIGIDAGLCWVGDPCYILHPKTRPKEIGKDWGEFCRTLHQEGQGPTAKQFNFDRGHAGLGVVVETGYGDGLYPVYAVISNGRIASLLIEFIGDEGMIAAQTDSPCDHLDPKKAPTAHSPAPWAYEYNPYLFRRGEDGPESELPAFEVLDNDCNLVFSTDEDAPADRQEANARLAAAAPAMLAALRAFVAAVDPAEEGAKWKWEGLDDALRLAREALALAA